MTTRQSEPIGTGPEIALAMARHCPEHDWVAELAKRSGRSRDTIEWHLQQAITPPAKIGEAAAAMLAAHPTSDDEPVRADATTKDDLPFSGLPGNLGKLHQD